MLDAKNRTQINLLISRLESPKIFSRQEARQDLVAMGRKAVAPLLQALGSHKKQLRWEAAKALKEIGNPEAARALVETLEDEESGIRWLAAEGLIALKREGLVPLLEALIKRSDSLLLRNGAHHVLRALRDSELKEVVEPLLNALDDCAPELVLPISAENGLDALRSRGL